MISYTNQEQLFKDIAKALDQGITCYAFGGTAMLYLGFKDETKDIDLIFANHNDRKEFIRAIKQLGFTQTSPITAYIQRKAVDENAPVMYEGRDARFDLFVQKIFRTTLSQSMQKRAVATHNYGKTLNLQVVSPQDIVLLKSVTNRRRDIEDALDIISTTTAFPWDEVVDEAIWQHNNGDEWILIDLEKTLQEFREHITVPPHILDRIYNAQP